MDRGHRHRAILSVAGLLGGPALFAGMGGLHAQTPTPVAAATPWVQASPPPGASPAKAAPTAVPTASPNREDLAKAMAHRREEELAKQQAELAKQKPTPARPPHAPPPQLSPEEHEAYERNLGVWQRMPPEEKAALRSLATERVQEEINKAYESSGLSLDADQREVFELRYRQERRRLERDLQEKARVERARRTPEILERLKREFGATAPKPTPKPTSTPVATPTPAK